MSKTFVFRVQERLNGYGAGLKADGLAGPATNAALDTYLPAKALATKRVSQAGVDLIHSFESCKLTAYPDPGSVDGKPWTIGWGSTGPGIARGVVWTQTQADDRFAADLARFEKAVALMAPVTTQNQFDALVSFAYNVGLAALNDSTLLRLHNKGDYAGAKDQFARWNKNDGKVMNGLTRRRAAEAAMYGKT
jgi:lysozyme